MTFNNVLKYIIYTGIFAVLFLPLFVPDSMFFPFITGKNFAFRIIVEIIFVSWAILAVRDEAYRPKKSGILLAFVAFVGIIAIADIFGENFYKSFWSNFERMEGLITHLHLLAYLVVISSVLVTGKLWERFFQTSLGVSAIVSVYGFLQLAGKITINQGGVRLDATFGNATYLAVYALFHVFISAILISRNKGQPFVKWLYGGIGLLNAIILYNTATRGAILGIIGGALLTALLIAIFEREKVVLRKISIGIIAGVILLIGVFVAVKDTAYVRDSLVLGRFSSLTFEEIKKEPRFMVWDIAIKGFKEHPILGWGQENFNLIFNKYYNPKMYSQEPFFDRAHNVFLDWLTAGGILGLTAYLSLFFFAIYYLWIRRNGMSVTERSILTGLLAGYFFHNLFVFDNLISYILFFSILGYIHSSYIASVSQEFSEAQHDENANPAVGYTIISLAIILVVATFYFSNTKGIPANRTLIKSMQPQEEGIVKNLSYFKKAIAYNTFGTPETREQLMSAARRVLMAENISQDVKSEFANTAVEEMLLQIDSAPDDARYELLLGAFLSGTISYDEAIKHLNRAIELSPGKQAIYSELASLYINKGEPDKAFGIAEYSYNLEKGNARALDVYAVTALYAGKMELAEELIMSQYGTLAVNDNRFLNAYAKLGMNELVVEIWRKRIAVLSKQGSGNAQYHVSLAAAYLNVGRRNEAVAELRRAIELNPEFKDQGEYYINEINAGRNP